MAAVVTKSELLLALKNTLANDVVGIVEEHSDWDLMLEQAAERMGRVIALRKRADLTLSFGVSEYDAPNDFIGFDFSDWGVTDQRDVDPWNDIYEDKLPTVSAFENGVTTQLQLDPPPTSGQIILFGTQYRFTYKAEHTLTDTVSTIQKKHRGIFLLLAQIQVMLFIARRNSGKPVSMRDGYTGTPRNGTPAALASQLEDELATQLAEHRRAA